MSNPLNHAFYISEPKLTHIQPGDKALGGKEEYLTNHYFDSDEETRWITGRGELIMIYDPAAIEKTLKKYPDTTVNATYEIPPNCVVEVIHAWVAIDETK
jgi:hypothetical protein